MKSHLSQNYCKSNELIKNIKHSVCEVALNYEQKMREFSSLNEEEKTYQLPDSSFIQITADIKYTSTESIFRHKFLKLGLN